MIGTIYLWAAALWLVVVRRVELTQLLTHFAQKNFWNIFLAEAKPYILSTFALVSAGWIH